VNKFIGNFLEKRDIIIELLTGFIPIDVGGVC